MQQAEHSAELFDTVLKRRGVKGYETTPVFAGIKYPMDDRRGYLIGVPQR